MYDMFMNGGVKEYIGVDSGSGRDDFTGSV